MNAKLLRFLYFSYKGRINRQLFWLGFLPLFLFSNFIIVLHQSINRLDVLARLFLIAIAYLGLIINIKRAHDRNKSGYFCLLWLVPVISIWPLIELGFIKGTTGSNQYGSDPLENALYSQTTDRKSSKGEILVPSIVILSLFLFPIQFKRTDPIKVSTVGWGVENDECIVVYDIENQSSNYLNNNFIIRYHLGAYRNETILEQDMEITLAGSEKKNMRNIIPLNPDECRNAIISVSISDN